MVSCVQATLMWLRAGYDERCRARVAACTQSPAARIQLKIWVDYTGMGHQGVAGSRPNKGWGVGAEPCLGPLVPLVNVHQCVPEGPKEKERQQVVARAPDHKPERGLWEVVGHPPAHFCHKDDN